MSDLSSVPISILQRVANFLLIMGMAERLTVIVERQTVLDFRLPGQIDVCYGIENLAPAVFW